MGVNVSIQSTHRCPPWLEATVRCVRWLAYHTGVLWLTPFVGMIDRSDLEYLLSCVMRDLAWLDVVVKGLGADETITRERLSQVRGSLEEIAGLSPSGSNPRLQPIRHPWDVPRGWTDYGAMRLALLASLPRAAWHPAVAELRNMRLLVLQDNRTTWDQRADNLEKQISDLDDLSMKDPTSLRIALLTAQIPHELQALWREIDFGRNSARARVAKQTTTAQITWCLVLAATVTVTVCLSYWAQDDGYFLVVPWFVTLCGLLGGSVSALRSLGFNELPDRASLEVEAVRLRLRPVVGAMSAIVFYVIGRSALVFEVVEQVTEGVRVAPVQIHVGAGHIPWAYYTLGFVAGFSERLFLGVLQTVSDRISRSSDPAKTTPPVAPVAAVPAVPPPAPPVPPAPPKPAP